MIASCKIGIREIEYVRTCVHFKELKRLEWLATLCTVYTLCLALLLHNSSYRVLSTFFWLRSLHH